MQTDGSLLATTRELLRTRSRAIEYQDITDAIGISQRTLKRIASGSHGAQCVNKIQALYEFLSGRKLDV